MLNNLKELEWEQNKNKDVVVFIANSEQIIQFKIPFDLINFLASNTPKMYHLFIDLDGQGESEYFVDMNNIRSTLQLENKLKITIKGKTGVVKSTKKQEKEKGKFAIARGESHTQRYLGNDGWQKQRKYFKLIDIAQASSKEAQKEKTLETKSEAAKLTKCIHCDEIIPMNLTNCPYCKKSQTPDESIFEITI